MLPHEFVDGWEEMVRDASEGNVRVFVADDFTREGQGIRGVEGNAESRVGFFLTHIIGRFAFDDLSVHDVLGQNRL